jgi:hypothetical protein
METHWYGKDNSQKWARRAECIARELNRTQFVPHVMERRGVADAARAHWRVIATGGGWYVFLLRDKNADYWEPSWLPTGLFTVFASDGESHTLDISDLWSMERDTEGVGKIAFVRRYDGQLGIEIWQ